jgi:hypothetical protein
MKNSDAFTSRLSLGFLTPGKNDLPGSARAYVYLKTPATIHGHGDVGVLTADAESFREFESFIDELVDELQDIKRKAKKKFADHDAAI